MAKVLLICGKICCGKSTYAKKLKEENNAVILSVDEIMLSIFGQHAGEKHDEYAQNTQKYLFNKAIEFVNAGTNVVLDWGFWKASDRKYAMEFYQSQNIECEMHYLEISEDTWKARLEKRNEAVLAGKSNDYFVDENLAKKFEAIFELPTQEEINVWVKE